MARNSNIIKSKENRGIIPPFIFFMEIEMTKSKKAFKFSGEIDLTQWDLPKTERIVDEAFEKMQNNIEKEIDKQFEKLSEEIGNMQNLARQIASESLNISLQKGLTANFWDLPSKPEIITIGFEDFCEDGFACEIDLKKAINEVILDRCAKDGYIDQEYEEDIILFAKMLRECAEIVETSIRPKDNK